jgi:hypothetical protein
MKSGKYLISNRLRPFGIVLFTIGIILLILKYQFNYKPDFLDLKVFALYSFYIEAKTFTIITHQMIADIAGIFLLTGLFIMSFTNEKNESDVLDSLRLNAFILTAYVNLFYLLASILFFFGFGFVGALTLFSVIWLATYLVIFRIMLHRSKRSRARE